MQAFFREHENSSWGFSLRLRPIACQPKCSYRVLVAKAAQAKTVHQMGSAQLSVVLPCAFSRRLPRIQGSTFPLPAALVQVCVMSNVQYGPLLKGNGKRTPLYVFSKLPFHITESSALAAERYLVSQTRLGPDWSFIGENVLRFVLCR